MARARQIGLSLEQSARGTQLELHNLPELIRRHELHRNAGKERAQRRAERATIRVTAALEQHEQHRHADPHERELAYLPPEVARIARAGSPSAAREHDRRGVEQQDRARQLERIKQARTQLLTRLPPDVARILEHSMPTPERELDAAPPLAGTSGTRAGQDARARERETRERDPRTR